MPLGLEARRESHRPVSRIILGSTDTYETKYKNLAYLSLLSTSAFGIFNNSVL
jgi:hypothetical protein